MRRYAVLTGEGPFRIRLLFQGILTGVAAGPAVVCYRLLLGFAGVFSFRALSGSAGISSARTRPPVDCRCAADRAAHGLGAHGKSGRHTAGQGGDSRPAVHGLASGHDSKVSGRRSCNCPWLFPGKSGPRCSDRRSCRKVHGSPSGKGEDRGAAFLSSGASAGLSAAFNAPLEVLSSRWRKFTRVSRR